MRSNNIKILEKKSSAYLQYKKSLKKELFVFIISKSLIRRVMRSYNIKSQIRNFSFSMKVKIMEHS